jgi:nitroreductase
MDVLAAIHHRFSVRSYADRAVDPALLERLLGFAEKADHLTDVPPRVNLITGVDAVRQVLTFMIGSYGLVYNAPHLLVGVLPKESESARVGLGYVLEQVVLEATRLRLGTCWITGNYNAKQAGDAVKMEPEEVAAAVCALGYPTEKGLGRLHTRVIRRLAGGHRRKPLSDIVFSRHWGEPWSPHGADPTLVTILKHARLAPSAHNGQPWRFVVGADQIALATVKPSFIDAGIVMSHVKLASTAAERPGQWELRLRDGTLARTYALPRRAIPVGTFTSSGS